MLVIILFNITRADEKRKAACSALGTWMYWEGRIYDDGPRRLMTASKLDLDPAASTVPGLSRICLKRARAALRCAWQFSKLDTAISKRCTSMMLATILTALCRCSAMPHLSIACSDCLSIPKASLICVSTFAQATSQSIVPSAREKK